MVRIAPVRLVFNPKTLWFDAGELELKANDNVVVLTARGLEFGVCELSPRTVTEREVVLPLRTVVRLATAEDISRHETNVKYEKNKK